MQPDPVSPALALTLFFTSAGLGLLAFWLFHRDRWNKTRLSFGFLVSAVSVWALGDFLQMVTSRGLADTWALVRFLGICSVGGLWFLLAFLYTGGRWLAIRRFLPLLFAPAVISYSLLFTNTWHYRFFTGSLSRFPENLLFGPAYWFHTFFSYLFLVSGLVLYVFHYFVKPERIYRRQTLVMILGCLVPLVGNVLFIFRLVRMEVDVTPLLLSVTVILYAVGIFRFALADLRPIAMDTILANLGSGVLILDQSGHVVGANPRMYEILDLREDVVGMNARELLDKIAARVGAPDGFRNWVREILRRDQREMRCSLDFSNEDKSVELTYAPIFEDDRRQIGGILFLHDMTEWKILQRSLERDRAELAFRNEELAAMNEELRRKNEELERFNRFAVDREMKMIELKRRLKELEGAG